MGLRSTRLTATILAALLSTTLAGCGTEPGSDGPVLTVYSGRNENLVKPLLDKAAKAIGAKLEVRYGDTAALAGQLAEEGEDRKSVV